MKQTQQELEELAKICVSRGGSFIGFDLERGCDYCGVGYLKDKKICEVQNLERYHMIMGDLRVGCNYKESLISRVH